MRVYELIAKALEFVGVDAAFGAGETAAGLLALKHLSKIKLVVVVAEFGAAMSFAWGVSHA